jgi:hypothetical protein
LVNEIKTKGIDKRRKEEEINHDFESRGKEIKGIKIISIY